MGAARFCAQTFYSGTYHGVGFAGTGLSVSEKTAVVAVPSVVEYLTSKRLKHNVLVGVLRARRNEDAVFIFSEAVVRPKRIIEGERTLFSSLRMHKLRRGPLLHSEGTS